MAIETKIGLEAEFLLRGTKGKIIVPPSYWDRDGFPLLAEIRGKEGKTPAEVVTNFMAKKMEIMEKMSKTHTMDFAVMERIPLALYKEANRQINHDEKAESVGQVRNIHGVDIGDMTDQIVAKNKIQGINVSCGLHVHFSCEEADEIEVEDRKYKSVRIPLGFTFANTVAEPTQAGIEAIAEPYIDLYRNEGYEVKKTLKARASRLTKPAVVHIVNEMDRLFFDRFAPPVAKRTKYRQPGFYELKP